MAGLKLKNKWTMILTSSVRARTVDASSLFIERRLGLSVTRWRRSRQRTKTIPPRTHRAPKTEKEKKKKNLAVRSVEVAYPQDLKKRPT